MTYLEAVSLMKEIESRYDLMQDVYKRQMGMDMDMERSMQVRDK